MPKEYLLKLSQLLQKLRLNKQPAQDLSQGNLLIVKRKNLLSTNIDYYTFRKLFFNISIGIQLFLLALLGLNYLSHLAIKNNEAIIVEKTQQIKDKRDVEVLLREVVDKTNFYKANREQKVILSERLNFLLAGIGSQNTIKSFELRPDSFLLTIETSQAVGFSLIINEYLQNDLIREITLTAASYDPSDQDYTLALEAKFK